MKKPPHFLPSSEEIRICRFVLRKDLRDMFERISGLDNQHKNDI